VSVYEEREACLEIVRKVIRDFDGPEWDRERTACATIHLLIAQRAHRAPDGFAAECRKCGTRRTYTTLAKAKAFELAHDFECAPTENAQ
jgi:hypothetical protein